MEQLLRTLSDLHQAADGVPQRVQQAYGPLAGSTGTCMLGSTKQQQQAKQQQPRRVHFTAPFASITSSFGSGSSGNGGRTGRPDKQSNKKDKQDEEEERILISEVRGCCFVLLLHVSSSCLLLKSVAALHFPPAWYTSLLGHTAG